MKNKNGLLETLVKTPNKVEESPGKTGTLRERSYVKQSQPTTKTQREHMTETKIKNERKVKENIRPSVKCKKVITQESSLGESRVFLTIELPFLTSNISGPSSPIQ